ncbi:MAG: Polysaccharide deacetylase, partial [Acidimicrobiales bacterium]|nr:Polysaccharide deacetylase [Acidimicrobiales bacterium]
DLTAGLALAAGEGRDDREATPAAAPIAITFDDGTADFVDVAVPILARHGLPATLFAATAFIDEGRPFPNDGRPASWAGLADAVATGLVQVGSHTHRHALLDRLAPAEIADELDRSIGLIGEHLGVPPRDFAYPKAVPGSPAADHAVRARFRSAALAGTRANPIGHTDPHRLARSPIQRSDDMRWFLRKADGGLRLEDALRRGLNRHRYAKATT